MSITVKIPAILRGFTDRAREVRGRGATVRELIDNLEVDYAGIGAYLVDKQGALRAGVNLFVNDENIRSLDGLDTKVSDGDNVSIVVSAFGG